MNAGDRQGGNRASWSHAASTLDSEGCITQDLALWAPRMAWVSALHNQELKLARTTFKIIIVVFFCFFWDKDSRLGLKLVAILLAQSPKGYTYRCALACQVWSYSVGKRLYTLWEKEMNSFHKWILHLHSLPTTMGQVKCS